MDINHGRIFIKGKWEWTGLSIYSGAGSWKEYKRMTISLDFKAILLLCSHIGLLSNSEYSSLTLKEWNLLAKKLQSFSMRPGDLLELTPEETQNKLGLNPEESERFYHLLQRSGSLAIELERLSSLGIHVLTRADQEYPMRYRQRLKETAPAVL